MTREVIEIESKNASRAHILTGIVTDIGDGVVDVDIDDHGVVSDIPVFYHCPDSETADGNPFSIDDRVIIVNSGGDVDVANMKVIGYEDGLPRECGFKIKLTRGDGTLITEDSGLLTYIQLYNSDNIPLSITELIYTPVPKTGEDVDGFWSFNLSDSADADENGYWVAYSCEDGIATQYPYRYKNDDKDKDEDLIDIGAYEDIIPYWNVTENEGDERDYAYPYDPDNQYCWDDILGFPAGWGIASITSDFIREGRYTLIDHSVASIKYTALTVRSSIPYKVRYRGEPKTAFPNGFYWLFYANGEDFIDPCSYKLITDNSTEKVITTGGTGLSENVIHEGVIAGTQCFITLEPIHKGEYRHTAIKGTIAYITINYDY